MQWIVLDRTGLHRIIQNRAGLYGVVQYCTGLCTGLHKICTGALLLYFLMIFLFSSRSKVFLAIVFVNHSALHILSLFFVIRLGVSFLFVILSSLHFQTHHGQ